MKNHPCTTTVSGIARILGLFALFAALSVGAACSDPPGTVDTEDGAADANIEPDGGAADDVAEDSAGGDADDVVEDTGTGVVDTVNPGDAPSTGDTGTTSCSSDQYCLTLLAADLKPCETASCEIASGTCIKQKKVGTCCDSSDCKDDNECTLEECDIATNTCKFEVKPNCCPGSGGNVNFADEGFEQGGTLPASWKSSNSLADSNVSWHISTNRARSGKRSLYLGNACKTYDTSMDEGKGCKPGDGKTFKAEVSTTEAIIPAKTDAIAHFWLWLDSEPLYTKTDDKKKQALDASNDCKPAKCAEKGKCAASGPCCFAETCVKFPDNGPTQCLGERDSLKLFVQVAGKKHAVWDSSCINKTTGGKWVHQAIHLAPFLQAGGANGSALKLIWEFDTGTGTLNDYEGAYIDDFKIETLCTGTAGYPQCSSTSPCSTKVEDQGLCGDPKCTTALNGALGLCFYDKSPACCESALDCDDKNSCTLDACKQDDPKKAGVCQNLPDSSNPQCCQPSSTFKDDFETGSTGGWDFKECNSTSVLWHATKNHKKSGNFAMCFSTTDGKGYDDPSIKVGGPKCTVCSKKIKISAATVYNVLSFAVKMKTEWTGAKEYKNPHPLNPDLLLDRLRVFTTDAGKEVDLWTSDSIKGTTANGGEDWFVALTPKLDQFAGKEKEICIQFDAGDKNGNTPGHVCIEDIAVDVSCTPKECTAPEHCTEGGVCTEAVCKPDFTCDYPKKADCCVSEKDCDDKNSCTANKCSTEGKCVYTVDPKNADCCSPATESTNGALLQEGFESGKKEGPDGWVLKQKSGQPAFGGGASYSVDKNFNWTVSALKSAPTTGGNFSLYFGNNGTFNAGTAVAAGTADSPAFKLQGSTKAHHVVAFDLFLDTEWSKAEFKKYPFAVDQLLILAKDVDDPKAKWLTVFDSYDIEGTTFGKWKSIVAKIPDALAGKNVQLRFDFDAGNVNSNQYQGAYIDNLAVETLCSKPACASVAECVKADSCQRYHCGRDATTKEAACQQEFKPGKGCCAPTLALPLETVEGGKFDQWEVAGNNIGDVNWHVLKQGTPGMPTYLNGKAEVRYGSMSKPHYMTGSGDKCATDSDCKTNGEKCSKAASGDKGCYLPVNGTLRSKVIAPDSDAKTGLVLRFKAYIDVEVQYESFQIVAVDETAQQQLGNALWTKAKLKVGDYKKVIDVEIDLKDLEAAGAKFRLEFRFDSGDAQQNDKFLGIHLDDLAIERTCL